jgi:hypothetical protein
MTSWPSVERGSVVVAKNAGTLSWDDSACFAWPLSHVREGGARRAKTLTGVESDVEDFWRELDVTVGRWMETSSSLSGLFPCKPIEPF